MPTSGSSASIIIGNENFSSNSNRRKSVSLDQSSTTPVAFLSRVLSTDSEFGCQITPVDGKKTKKRIAKQHYKQESPILPLLSPTIKNLTEDVNIGQTAFEFGAIVRNDDNNDNNNNDNNERNRNDRGLPTRARSNGRHLLQGLPPIKTGFTNNSSSSIDASDIEIHVQSSDNENDASDINNNDNDIKKKHKKSNDSDSDIHTDSDNSSEYNASDDEDHNTFIGILNNPSYDTITPPKVMTELSESRNLSHASRSSRSGNFRNHNQRPNNANIKSFNKNGECPFTFASVKGGGMTPSAFSPFGFKFIENVGIKSFAATVARVKSNAGSDISDVSRFSHLDATQLRPHASTIGSSGSRDESKDNSRNIHTIHEANESFDDLDLPVFTNNVSSQHPPLNIQVTSPNDDKTRKSSVSLSMRTANLHDKNEINEETANMKAMFSDAYHRASVSMSHGINAMSRKLHTKQRKQAGLSTTQLGTTQVNPLYRINNANDDNNNNNHHNIATIELPFDTNNNSSDTRRSTNSNDNNDDRRVTLSSDRGMDDTAIKNSHTTNNITLPEGNNYLMSSQTASGNSSDMDSDAKESTTATAPKPQKLTKLDNLEEFIRQVTATTDTKSYELTNALLFSYPLFGDSLNFMKILRTMFIRSKVYEIQSSIAQLIFSWIEQFWKEDFMGNFLLLSELKQFVYNDLKNQCVDHAKISRLESVFQTFLQANLNSHNNNNSKTSLEISGGILPTVATTFTSLTAKSPVSVYSPGGMGGMGGMGAGAASPSPDLSTPKVGSGSVSMLSKKNILSKNVSNGTSKSEDITLSNEIWNRWPYLNETLLMCSKTKKQKFNKTEYFEMMKLKIENRDTNKIKWNIMQYGKPTEIACQLTLMDHFVFLQIGKRECIAQGWKKEDKWERAPNLLQMIGQFNSVSTWCQLAIITCVSNKERSKMIEFVIKIAQHLYTLQNFSSLCAIHGALVSTPIQRYKSAWNKVRKKYNAMLQDISTIFHWRSNKLRELHNESKGALIPHIGVILQTMIAIEEADDVLDDNRINTHKMCIIASQVEKIVRWQKESYDKIVKTEKLQCSIVHDFLEQSHLTEDDVWNMSKESMKKGKK